MFRVIMQFSPFSGIFVISPVNWTEPFIHQFVQFAQYAMNEQRTLFEDDDIYDGIQFFSN